MHFYEWDTLMWMHKRLWISCPKDYGALDWGQFNISKFEVNTTPTLVYKSYAEHKF